MKILLAASAALLLSLSAAQAVERDGSRLITALDSNGDGSVSKAELQEVRDRIFEMADRNHDGVIDAAELKDARDRMQERADAGKARSGLMFRRLDTDGDGKVSKQEVDQKAGLFDVIDRNGDGRLTKDEMATVGKLFASRAP